MCKTVIVIGVCTVANVVLCILTRRSVKRSKVGTDERGADSLARRAEHDLDATEQCHKELATAIDDCKRTSTTASELTARAEDLNARAREICKNSRKLLAETQDLLEDCSTHHSSD